MAHDTARNRTVLFGGYGLGSNALGDTWEWDGVTWQLRSTTGPVPRYASAMAFDSVRNRVVLFGGTCCGTNYGDTWEWDGAAWIPRLLATGPVARCFHSMAFDSARGRTVLFGGSGIASSPASYALTWEWDGNSWAQVATGGPSGRDQAAMAYDPARGRTVLCGGRAFPVGTALDDTWEWNGTTWVLGATGGIVANGLHAMAYDGRSAILFGGNGPSPTASLHAWNGAGWVLLAASGPTRVYHAMAFDPVRARAVVFGGADAGGSYAADTWEWDRGDVPFAVPFGVGCGNPALGLSRVGAALPVIGQAAQATLSNTPSPLAFVALGMSKEWFGPFPLPVTLAGIGMPGCHLLQSAEVVSEPTTPTGPTTALYSFAIPNSLAIVGMHVFLQAWAFAPGANPGQLIASNGLDWRIGF